MHWFLPSLLICVKFQSVCGVVNNFTEIKITVDDNKSVEELSVSPILSGDEHFEWMSNRTATSLMLCSIHDNAKSISCYCDEQNGRCWDYNEITNSIYMIPRDRANSSIPVEGSTSDSVKNISSMLDVLHEYEEVGMALYNMKKNNNLKRFNVYSSQFKRIGSNGVVINKNGMMEASLQSERNETTKIPNRGDVRLRILGIGTDAVTFEMFCRGGVCPGGDAMKYLLIRRKLFDVYESSKSLQDTCQFPNLTYYECPMDEVKKIIPLMLRHVLNYQQSSASFNRLRLNISMLNSRYIVKIPSEKESIQGVGGVIICYLLALLFFGSFVMTFRSALSDEPEVERKPIKKSHLHDKEQCLEDVYVRKLFDIEEGSVTLEAACALEEASFEQKRAKKERQGATIESRTMVPVDSSALGSRMDSDEGRERELQETQPLSELVETAQPDSLTAHTAPSTETNTPPVVAISPRPDPVPAPVLPAPVPAPVPPTPVEPPSIPPTPPSSQPPTSSMGPSTSTPYDARSAELVGREMPQRNGSKEANTPAQLKGSFEISK